MVEKLQNLITDPEFRASAKGSISYYGAGIRPVFHVFTFGWNMGLNTPGAADLLADLSYTKLLKNFLPKNSNWRSAR